VWNAPITFVSGAALPAATLNTDIRDNLLFLYQPPMVLARRVTNMTIPDSAETAIAFNGSDFYDTDTMHDPTQNNTQITINTAGVYLFAAALQFDNAATGQRHIRLFQDGATEVAGACELAPLAGAFVRLNCSTLIDMLVGEYMEVEAYQGSGQALQIDGTTAGIGGGFAPCYFGASWVGAGV
jgi:hypothetical protein